MGNFLEHARIFCFENDGKPEYYCASADWMPRNLERRVEILFPIEKPALQEKLKLILDSQLKDTVKAHILQPNGSYTKVDRRGKEVFNAQLSFCEEAREAVREKTGEMHNRVFIPKTHQS